MSAMVNWNLATVNGLTLAVTPTLDSVKPLALTLTDFVVDSFDVKDLICCAFDDVVMCCWTMVSRPIDGLVAANGHSLHR